MKVLEEVLGAKVPILKLKVDGAGLPSARFGVPLSPFEGCESRGRL